MIAQGYNMRQIKGKMKQVVNIENLSSVKLHAKGSTKTNNTKYIT